MSCDREDFKLTFPAQNHVRELLLGVPDDSGELHFWIKTGDHPSPSVDELLVYLTPRQAMAFSKALRRLAIIALEDSA